MGIDPDLLYLPGSATAATRMTLRLLTWNINSLRLRLPLLERLVAESAPDVVCLQETKVHDPQFPEDGVRGLGFPHIVYHGIKGYNGVAILSRRPFAEAAALHHCGREDARHVFARIEDGPEIHSVYIPSGGDVPDREANDKFAHKLDFLTELAEWWTRRQDSAAARIMVGDFNVAPLESDVWSHKQLLDVVSHTPVEVEHLDRLMASHGWIDAVRHFVPPEERLYSWWSYRARDWAASDRGRRLDHIWVTPALRPALAGAEILRAARGWTRPSDHAPVIVELAGAGGGAGPGAGAGAAA